MVIVFYGADWERILAKVKGVEQSFYKKAGAASAVFRFDETNFSAAALEEALRHESMFGDKRLVLVRDVIGEKESKDAVLDILEKGLASGVTVVFYERKLEKEYIKKLEKIGAKIQEYPLKSAASNRLDSRPLFAVTDAIMAKNRYRAFAGFHRARSSGFSAENIFWTIYNQFKNMLIINSLSKNPPQAIQKETGLHPFVIKKGFEFMRNFSRSELEEKFIRLMFLWSDAILEQKDLSSELELFILRN